MSTTAAATVGERFVRSLAAKDWPGVAALLRTDVDFRGLTPSRQWEANSAAGVIEQVLQRWFEPNDEIYEVIDIACGSVVDRERVVYRLRVRNGDGDFVCEQTAYYDAVDGRITTLRILCSGFIPAACRGAA